MIWTTLVSFAFAAPLGAAPSDRCAWGDAIACGRESRAVAELADACDSGELDACVTLVASGSLSETRAETPLLRLLEGCTAGSGLACGNAAFLERRGHGGPPDLSGAFSLYKAGCEAGHGPSCCEQAGAHRWGRGTPLDPEASYLRYRATCEGGDACGCTGMSLRELEGRGAPEDPEGALTRLSELCDRDHAWACSEIGVARSGRGEMELARAAFARSCALGSAWGCSRQTGLDDTLSAEEKLAKWQALCDEGSPRACHSAAVAVKDDDAKRAHELYERACSLGSPSGCRNVGIDLGKGRGIAEDDVAAVTAYERASAMGDLPATRNLGHRARTGNGTSQSTSMAATWFREACAREDVRSCDELAEMHSEGVLQPATPEAALAHLWPSCNAGNDFACAKVAYWLTPIVGHPFFGDPATRNPRVGEVADRACASGHNTACLAVAIRAHVGLDGVVDDARAAAAADEACEAGNPVGCARRAWHLDNGAGVPVDRDRALVTWQQACDAGYSLACRQLELRPLLQWLVVP